MVLKRTVTLWLYIFVGRSDQEFFYALLKTRPSSLFIVRVELQLNCLPDKFVHKAIFGTENLCVLEVYEVMMVEYMFHHHQFVWLYELDVLVVLLYSGLDGLT